MTDQQNTISLVSAAVPSGLLCSDRITNESITCYITYHQLEYSVVDLRRTITWICATLQVDNLLRLSIQLIVARVQQRMNCLCVAFSCPAFSAPPFQRCIDCVDIARRSSARGRQTTLRWQKQVFIHTAVARLPGVSQTFLSYVKQPSKVLTGSTLAGILAILRNYIKKAI